LRSWKVYNVHNDQVSTVSTSFRKWYQRKVLDNARDDLLLAAHKVLLVCLSGHIEEHHRVAVNLLERQQTVLFGSVLGLRNR